MSFCLLGRLNNDIKWRIQVFFLGFNDLIIRKSIKTKYYQKKENWNSITLNSLMSSILDTMVVVAVVVAWVGLLLCTTFASSLFLLCFSKQRVVRKLTFWAECSIHLAAISRKLYYTNIGYFCISTTRHKGQATPGYESTSNSIKVH